MTSPVPGWRREVRVATLRTLQQEGATLDCARACEALPIEQQARVIVDVNAVQRFISSYGRAAASIGAVLDCPPLENVLHEAAARNLIEAAQRGARAHELPLGDVPAEWRQNWHLGGNGN